ncbi:hypothetical protein MPSEU_001048100 [Mayamaea pseudoterrestris]|nr:hypothetical protein MPSEU_001048100 [Mayamaea pseudoterrestris]
MAKPLITLLFAAFLCLSASSFAVLPQTALQQRNAIATRAFLFGPPKDDGSPGDYVCKDCGYVFTKGPKAWAALPDNYGCPPCGAPKRRFNKVPKGSASGKMDVKKKWF